MTSTLVSPSAMAGTATVYAAIYDRASRAIGDDETSVDRQQRANDVVPAKKGWTLRDRYTDNSKSASRFGRKTRDEWLRLVDDVKAGLIQVIIMWEASRGGRELEAWAALLNLCRSNGILIYATKRDRIYDVRKAEDWKELAQEGVASAVYSDELSLSIRSGNEFAAFKGRPAAKAPYGLERFYDQKNRKKVTQVADPDTAPIVQRIFWAISKGVAIAQIVRELNAAEVPTPSGGKKWNHTSVTTIARRKIYIQQRDHFGGIFKVNTPRLVSDEMFYAVQRILGDPSRNPHTEGKNIPGRAAHELSCIARCGPCGAPLGARDRKGRRAYRCKGKGCVSIGADDLDEYVLALAADRLSRPDLWAHVSASDDSAIVAARAEADYWRVEIDNAKGHLKSGTFTVDDLANMLPGLRKKLAAAQERARMAAAPVALRSLLGPDERGREMTERLGDLTVSARRDVIKALMTITVGKGLRGVPGGHPLDDPERVKIEWIHTA